MPNSRAQSQNCSEIFPGIGSARSFAPGQVQPISMHSGSTILLHPALAALRARASPRLRFPSILPNSTSDWHMPMVTSIVLLMVESGSWYVKKIDHGGTQVSRETRNGLVFIYRFS